MKKKYLIILLVFSAYHLQAQKMSQIEQKDVDINFNLLEKRFSRDVILRSLLFLPKYKTMLYNTIDTSRIVYDGRIGRISGKRLISREAIIEQLSEKEKEALFTKVKKYILNSFSYQEYWEDYHSKVISFISLEDFFDLLSYKEIDEGWDELYVAFASYPLIEEQVNELIKEHEFRILEEHYDHPDFTGEVVVIVLNLSDKQQLEFCSFLIKWMIDAKKIED